MDNRNDALPQAAWITPTNYLARTGVIQLHPYTFFIVVTATLFSSASLAQSAASSTNTSGSGQTSGNESTTKTGSTTIVDCRKEMANAKEAQQAGHITDKEYSEQRKMAETKLKRDSKDPRRAEKNVACK